ncbi:MAG: hypothetical protein SF052_01835 [Bacteroidia bacterium]|nr:hypothetical protein [Bacteroidia bacterium]
MIEMFFAIGGALVVILLGLIVLRNKKTIFWISFILCFTPLGYLSRFFNVKGPFNLNWFAFFALVALALGTALFKINKTYFPRGPMLVYIGIALISFLSMLLNYIVPYSVIFPQRGYLMMFSYFALFRTVYDYYDKEDIFSFVVLTGIVSSLYAVFQRIVFVSILKLGSADMVTGLFPADGGFNYYQLICLTILVVYWFQEKPIKNLPIPVPAALLIIVGSFAFANDKVVFIFLFIIIGVIIAQTGFEVIKKHIPKLVGGFLFLSVVAVIFTDYQDEAYSADGGATTTEKMADPEFYKAYIFGDDSAEGKFAKGGQLKRGAAVVVALEQIQKSTFHYLFGRGPGATSQNSLRGAEGKLDKEFPGWDIGRTALSWYIAETGMLGMIFQILFIISIGFWNPPGMKEQSQFKIIRITYTIFTALYITFDNLYFLPVFGFLVVVMTYPIQPGEVSDSSEEEIEKSSKELVINH